MDNLDLPVSNIPQKSLNRLDFMRVLGLAGAGLLSTACGVSTKDQTEVSTILEPEFVEDLAFYEKVNGATRSVIKGIVLNESTYEAQGKEVGITTISPEYKSLSVTNADDAQRQWEIAHIDAVNAQNELYGSVVISSVRSFMYYIMNRDPDSRTDAILAQNVEILKNNPRYMEWLSICSFEAVRSIWDDQQEAGWGANVISTPTRALLYKFYKNPSAVTENERKAILYLIQDAGRFLDDNQKYDPNEAMRLVDQDIFNHTEEDVVIKPL